jgi:hypothetical protein
MMGGYLRGGLGKLVRFPFLPPCLCGWQAWAFGSADRSVFRNNAVYRNFYLVQVKTEQQPSAKPNVAFLPPGSILAKKCPHTRSKQHLARHQG